MIKAYLFDIDGVLTDPQIKKPEKPLLKKITKLLKNNVPVALVTGRSVDWIKKNVFPVIEQDVNKKELENLFLSAEKGAVHEMCKNGKWQHSVKKELSPPENFKTEIRSLIESEFQNYVFLDPKETMISIEMRDDISIGEFKKMQDGLNKDLEVRLNKANLEKDFELDPSLISTDIQHKNSGKDLAAEDVLNWLLRKNIKPDLFYAFGDSKTDISMATHLHKEGFKVNFIFVGEKELLENVKPNFPVEIFDKQYFMGTLKYLEKLNL